MRGADRRGLGLNAQPAVRPQQAARFPPCVLGTQTSDHSDSVVTKVPSPVPGWGCRSGSGPVRLRPQGSYCLYWKAISAISFLRCRYAWSEKPWPRVDALRRPPPPLPGQACPPSPHCPSPTCCPASPSPSPSSPAPSPLVPPPCRQPRCGLALPGAWGLLLARPWFGQKLGARWMTLPGSA